MKFPKVPSRVLVFGRFSTLGLLTLLGLCGCQGALPPPASEEGAHFRELVRSLAERFGPLDMEPKLAALRPRLARASLVPSPLFGDATAWTEAAEGSRILDLVGKGGGARYKIGIGSSPLSEAADYRGKLSLTRLGPGEYEWRIREELAVGHVSGAELDSALIRLLSLLEQCPEGEVGDKAREALPHAAKSLGRLLTLDSLKVVHGGDGGTALNLGVSLHTEGIRKEYPRYSRYLDGFTPTIHFALRLGEVGGEFWEVLGEHNRLNVRIRVQNGKFVPLSGAPSPMPLEPMIRIDYTIKVGIFRVGATSINGVVTREHTKDRRAFSIRFTREPHWSIPFFVEPLMHATLRRPFEGEGSAWGLGIEDGEQTRLTQDVRAAVREGWIVRWLGGLIASTVIEYENGPEEEAGAFIREGFTALLEDIGHS